MKWFYKWLGSKIQDSQYNEVEESPTIGIARPRKTGRPIAVRESDDLHSEPIMFKMFKANGGWAIEFRQYDPKKDQHETSLYVVNDEEELGKHISHIITMEALKR
jgi:hypothetical protein